MGFRGEQSLSASLSGTRRSSLPLREDRRLFDGVIGGGLAATTTLASIAAQAESAISRLSSSTKELTSDGGRSSGNGVVEVSKGGDRGAHASARRRRNGERATRFVLGLDNVDAVSL